MTRGRAPADRPAANFSPVDDEPPLRWWRRLRIVPAGELGVGRRAVLLALVSWVPIAAWAFHANRFLQADGGEPLLQHYGIHVRCLIAVPLLVLAEAGLHRIGRVIARQFAESGVVGGDLRLRFDAAVRDVQRVRDRSLPWVLAVGVALAWTLVERPSMREDALAWAVDADGSLRFGGWWFLYVARPIFVALLLGWLWRLALVTYWMWRIGRLGLSLVPTHPDRTGGIGFIGKLPGAFALVTLALSSVLASRWAHEVLHHGAHLASYRLPALAYAVLWTLLLCLPLFALAPALRATRRTALPAYAALVGEQGRLVHRRWIEREPVEDRALLEAAEIGPVADARVVYDAVRQMRSMPIGRATLIGILVPMAIPFILLALLEFPLVAILSKLLKALV